MKKILLIIIATIGLASCQKNVCYRCLGNPQVNGLYCEEDYGPAGMQLKEEECLVGQLNGTSPQWVVYEP